MKVIIVGDTHMPKRATHLPMRLKVELETADRIIHTGDWNSICVYDQLKQFAPVDGVAGNTDDKEILKRFKHKERISIKGFKIGLVHGHGTKKTTEKRALESFEPDLDLIIFGHSHIPYTRYHNKTLLFNPGSVTDKRKLPYYSFGVMHIEEHISLTHVFFN
ncbi:metallophosphoesterase family protein [Alteribacter aurantiacus]|uniref:metallophosphoesterase family protein n=1 Tax=Alteribacter aurantiacus TaxID=254410 RepID=UPI000409E129|nr:metallophosphoesterase family protein [Alteribacter aurantiacus]